MAKFMFEYPYRGKRWGLTIDAADEQEACERVGALRFAKYAGEEIARFPATSGPIVRLICWLKNWRASRRSL